MRSGQGKGLQARKRFAELAAGKSKKIVKSERLRLTIRRKRTS
jgi:hypothetical protein